MLKTGTGEFAIFNANDNCTVFYKAQGKFFKDIFIKNVCQTQRSIEIPKDEYLRKLDFFRWLIKNERIEE